MQNNYIAAARLLGSLECSYGSAENISVNYTFCVKISKKIFLKIYV